MAVEAGDDRVNAVPTTSTSFEVFYLHHWAATVAVTAALSRDVAVGEELAQEAFLRAYGRWSQVSRLDRPELWVRRVALNLAVSRFRRLQAERRALRRARSGHAPSQPPSTPELEDFWDALRSLPARQGQVAALFYVDDLPIARIAEVLQCAEGTIKAHLHAARQQLRGRLDHPREGRS